MSAARISSSGSGRHSEDFLSAKLCYAEIARRIGVPNAVAGAGAANILAVAFPCYRVVRNGGSLSGYACGVERKKALIEREASQRV